MKRIKIIKELEIYVEQCPICHKKEITGISQYQVESRMSMHQRSKECKSYRKIK